MRKPHVPRIPKRVVGFRLPVSTATAANGESKQMRKAARSSAADRVSSPVQHAHRQKTRLGRGTGVRMRLSALQMPVGDIAARSDLYPFTNQTSIAESRYSDGEVFPVWFEISVQVMRCLKQPA